MSPSDSRFTLPLCLASTRPLVRLVHLLAQCFRRGCPEEARERSQIEGLPVAPAFALDIASRPDSTVPASALGQ
jgi:hypothetical protein